MEERKPAIPIQIEAEDWAEVLAILKARVPDREVWVFGSRSTGRAKPYSDVELAFAGAEPMSLDLRAELAEAFENSGLPFRVDLVDLAGAEPGFAARVKSGGVVAVRRTSRD